MADDWLALEVLRELDEADAMYFALAIQSLASLEHLVSLGGREVASLPTLVLAPTLCSCLTLVLGIG